MKTVAVVPINALAAAKSRLSGTLDERERGTLVLWMAGRVLDALHDSGAVDAMAVVSPDVSVLRWAEDRGAVPLQQSQGRLNDGIELGREWALPQHADALLVLLADLPCLAAEDVRELVRAAETAGETVVVLAPDRRDEGTNGMILRPPGLMRFAYGSHSFRRHLGMARAAGVETVLRRAPGTCFDVDTAVDLDELGACGMWTRDERGTSMNGGGPLERTPAGRLALRHMATGRRPLAGEPG